VRQLPYGERSRRSSLGYIGFRSAASPANTGVIRLISLAMLIIVTGHRFHGYDFSG
jgi:hypothetical protein